MKTDLRHRLRPWMRGETVTRQEANEISAKGLPLLDQVIRDGWGESALAKYNADNRPAFAAFRQWAKDNLPGSENL